MMKQIKEQNVQLIMPVNDRDIVNLYQNAEIARSILRTFLERLNDVISYKDRTLQRISEEIRLTRDESEAVMVVEAKWLGKDWTAKAAEDFVNLYIKNFTYVDFENHDDEYYDPDDDGFN